MAELRKIRRYEVRVDLAYDPATHLWVERLDNGRVRIGMDPLGAETSGTLAQVSLVEAGTRVQRGEPLGMIEAEKFVGPVSSPLSGTVSLVNAGVAQDPSVIERDPYGAGWLVEFESVAGAELDDLTQGADTVATWFAEAVKDAERHGVLAL